MTDYLGSLDSSRDLQTGSVIIFMISLCLVLQIQKDDFSKILQAVTKHGPSPYLEHLSNVSQTIQSQTIPRAEYI